MKRLLFAIPLLSAACAQDLPTSSPRLKASQQADSVALTAEEQSKKFKQLITLKEENNALCVRRQTQVAQCPLAAPLIPDDGDKVLGCISGVDPNARLEVDYQISVQPPAGHKIYLSTKGRTWRTNEVGAGSNQKLTWGPRSSDSCSQSLRTPPKSLLTQVRAPKLLELSELEVVLVPDDKSLCLNNQNRVNAFREFTIFQNGQTLFTKSDLSFDGARHIINLSSLDSKIDDPKCSVPPDEIEQILADARLNLPPTPAAIPATLGDELNREQSRNNALMLALTGQVKLGCWAFQKVDKLEVKLDGATVERKPQGTGGEMSGSGNSKGFTFTFGSGLVHSIGDASGLFRSGGGFATTDFADRMIQELQYLKIEKQGTAFENEEFSSSYPCWRGLNPFATCTKRGFRSYEIDIRSVSAIEIKVGDQVIYQNSAINFTFEQGKMVWPGGNRAAPIYENPKYRELMRRTDCPAGG